MSDRKGQVKKAASIIGSFLFGSKEEVAEQLDELGEAVEEKVEEVRFRKRIGGPPAEPKK